MTTNAGETRADRFVREVAALKIPDPANRLARLWLRAGIALMVLGAVLGISAYVIAHTTLDALVQRDAITIGLGGVGASVIGSALFLRYSLTGFLRFWMARQSYDLDVLAERLTAGKDSIDQLSTRDIRHDAASR
jgi:hypothetical protein